MADVPVGAGNDREQAEMIELLTSPPKRGPKGCPRCGGLGGTYEPVLGGREFVPCSCKEPTC